MTAHVPLGSTTAPPPNLLALSGAAFGADAPDDGEFCETHICGPCRVGEGDCDSDAQCLGDAICDQRSGNDYCIAASSCDDDASFVDAQGYDCDDWDGYDCDDATSRYGYSQAEEDAIVAFLEALSDGFVP